MSDMENEHCSEQMRTFFRDYLEDITNLIHKIKSNLYDIIGINSKEIYAQKVKLRTTLASILTNCKRTFEQIKRIDSILQGYTLGKLKSQPNFHQSRKIYNNLTFQNGLQYSNASSYSSRDINFDSMTLNTQNQLDKPMFFINKKNKFLKNSPYKIQDEIQNRQKINSYNLSAESYNPNIFKNQESRSSFNFQMDKDQFKERICKQQKNRVNTMQDFFEQNKNKNSYCIELGKYIEKQTNYQSTSKQLSRKTAHKARAAQNIIFNNSQCFNIIKQIRRQLSK